MKGQVSQEFFVALSAYLVIFIAAVSLSMLQLASFNSVQGSLSARDMAQTVGLAIDRVHLAGENASYDLSFAKGSANVTIEGRFVVVSIGSAVHDFPLLTDRLNASEIRSSDITLRNHDGVVEIEEH